MSSRPSQLSLFPKPRPAPPRVAEPPFSEVMPFDFLADGDLVRLVPQPDFVPPEEIRIADLGEK